MESLSNSVPIGVLLRDRDGGEVRVGRDGEPVVRYKLSDFDAAPCAHRDRRRRADPRGCGSAADLQLAGEVGLLRARTQRAAGSGFMADADAAGYGAGQLSMGSFHIMGSARMGGSPATSACDPTGQTWDVRDLYVFDGSAFPSASGVNPQISIQAIAHMGARGAGRAPQLSRPLRAARANVRRGEEAARG